MKIIKNSHLSNNSIDIAKQHTKEASEAMADMCFDSYNQGFDRAIFMLTEIAVILKQDNELKQQMQDNMADIYEEWYKENDMS